MRRLWIASAMVVGSLFAGAHAVSAGQTHARPPAVYHVQPGDTLWSIAGKLAPAKDPREVVDDLMRQNHLGSPTIVAGQTLHLLTR